MTNDVFSHTSLRNKTTLLELGSCHAHSRSKEVLTQMDEGSLAHTRWECKYHVVFPPKYSVSQIMGYLKGSVASSSSIDMRSDAFATASFFILNRWCGCLRSIHLGLLLCDRWLYRYRDPGFVRTILPYCEREKEHHREDSSAPKD